MKCSEFIWDDKLKITRQCKNNVLIHPCTKKPLKYCKSHEKKYDIFPLTMGGCRITSWSDRAL